MKGEDWWRWECLAFSLELAAAAIRSHDKVFAETQDGGIIEVSICKKWKRLDWTDEQGQSCFDLWGTLNEQTPCSCGADEHNQKIMALTRKLNIRLTHCV